MIEATQQDIPENTTPDDPSTLNGPDDAAPDAQPEPSDAPQTAGEDPAPTSEQSGRRKKRTRAEIEAAVAAGEPPPRKRNRAAATTPDAPSDEEPAAAPLGDTHVSVNANPIDGKATAEAINAAAATRLRGAQHRRVHIDEVAFNGAVPGARRSIPVTLAAPPAGLDASNIDTRAVAKARLKVYGKFAARARAAAQLWPKDPARYFDVVGKIFTDLAHGECRVDALRYDRDAVAELVIGLLPKSTVEVIECSGITTL